MSAAKDQQVLPQREQSLFKSVLKHYESKAYKKALAAADEILERYPHNGETLAMKGLVLSSMPDCKDAKKKEALDLIKEGVRYNLASCTTWHVLGLYHRADKNYPEAVKCYKSALRYDKENQQIMRDLSYMQIHSQDYEGFFDTRKKLLLGKGQPANFVGMAVAAHLLNGAAPALAVIDGYLSEQPKPKNPDPEHSEVLMYRLSLAEDITAHEPEATRPASYAKLLKWLNENEGQIMDKMALREKRARLLLLSGDRHAAAQSYRELLELNPENKAYYIALQEAALGAQPTIADVLALYSDLEKRHPKSNLCRLMRLRALPAGSEFAAALDAFVQRYVRKGVPSLFQLLRWVYDEPARASALGEIAEKHVKALEAEGVFAGAAAEEPLEPPTTLLWALHLLAQHLAHVGQCCRALEVIDRAIKHTPTAVDLYVCRGRILKKAGDLQGAADAVEKARSMDQADRFLNTLSTRYHLRAGRTELGLATISPFAKDAPDVLTGLADMQCAWFENELARCRLSRGEPGAALHALAATAKHYADYRDDMFDFHYYGPFRRGTLRDYLATLRATSELDRHPFRVRAAVTAARAWLAFCDAPAAAVEAAKLPAVVPLASAMPPAPAEDKKEKQKKVKQAKESGEAPAKPADADPNGLKLLESARADPLREAAAALAPLLAAASSPEPSHWAASPWAARLSVELHLVACDVHTRRGKRLLALRELRRAARAIGCADARVCERAAAIFRGMPDASTSPVAAALHAERDTFAAEYPDAALPARELAQKHKGSLAYALAAARSIVADGGAAADAALLVTEVADPQAPASTLLLPQYVDALSALRGPLKASEAACEAYRARCAKLFPLANAFASPATASATASKSQ